MKEIKQTPFGTFLCWLGVHALVTSGANVVDGRVLSAWGGCVRCNGAWQWDNP